VRSTIAAVDVEDLRHVVELQQAVRGERLVARIGAEPLVALLLALVAGDLRVAARQQRARACRDGGHVVSVRVEQREHERVRVVRRARLLEAAVRLLQDAREPVGERADRRRVDLERHVARAWHRVARDRDGAGRRRSRFDAAAERTAVREAARRDRDALLHAVGEAAAARLELDHRGAGGVLDLDRQQRTAAAIAQRDAHAAAFGEAQAGAELRADGHLGHGRIGRNRVHGDLQAVARRHFVRQLRFDLQRLLRREVEGALAESPDVGRGVRVGAHAPRGHRVARREARRGVAARVGDEQRVPVDRRREVAALVARVCWCAYWRSRPLLGEVSAASANQPPAAGVGRYSE
jgi:hypothetical protein